MVKSGKTEKLSPSPLFYPASAVPRLVIGRAVNDPLVPTA